MSCRAAVAWMLLCLGLPPASAQIEAQDSVHRGDMSVDDIIASLKPTAGNLTGPTRGVRVPAMAMPQAGGGAPPPQPAVALTVAFAPGAAVLTPAGETILTRLGRAMSSADLKSQRFRVEVHGDEPGRNGARTPLSARRAHAVVGFLEHRCGIPASRLVAAGLGPDQLLSAPRAPAGAPRDQPVWVVNLGS